MSPLHMSRMRRGGERQPSSLFPMKWELLEDNSQGPYIQYYDNGSISLERLFSFEGGGQKCNAMEQQQLQLNERTHVGTIIQLLLPLSPKPCDRKARKVRDGMLCQGFF